MVETPAPPAPQRFIALDSLRGIAALFIVFYHMGNFGPIAGWMPFRSGWMLVDFFFVLSGFVIAMSYGGRLAGGYPRGPFLAVRLGRVYPLHLAVVAGFTLLEFTLFRPVLGEAHGVWEWLRGTFLLDTFRTGAGNFYAPVSWAVGVEMALYALAALLFGRGRPALAITVAIAATSAWALYTGFNVTGFGRLIQRGLLAFPVGVLMFAIHRRFAGVAGGGALLTVLELGLVALFVWVMYLPGHTASWIPFMDLLYAAMVLVFARDGGLVSRVLQTKPLVKLGQLSFALYMVHLFWIILPNRLGPRVLADIGRAEWIAPGRRLFGLESMALPPAYAALLSLVLLAGAFATAWLAWRFIEEPAREWSRRFAPKS